MSKITVGRVGLLIILPFAIIWTVVARVLRELSRIPFYIWCDLREECADFRRYWEDAR